VRHRDAALLPAARRAQPQLLLGFVLQYRNAALQRIRAGVVPREVLDAVRTALTPTLEATRFSKPAYATAARKLLETGGGVFSHPVGLAVHDDGEYQPRTSAPSCRQSSRNWSRWSAARA